jgi:HD-like signal output (HDOD) protein
MSINFAGALDHTDNCDFVHGLMEQCLRRGDLDVPMLPEVALRVVRAASDPKGNAESLAKIVGMDPALTMYMLRVAGSAANRPAASIVSVQQAVAWLGFEEVANIAFTLALQGRILDVPGQNHRARQLWRHALASALWSKHLATMLARDGGTFYLCGLLHNIGKLLALGVVHELARRVQVKLTREEYDRLLETFHHPIGILVTSAWDMPPAVQAAAAHWDSYLAAGAARFECNVVNVAHRLSDATLCGPTGFDREIIMVDPAYLDLGLTVEDGAAVFDATASIQTDLDRYLSP